MYIKFLTGYTDIIKTKSKELITMATGWLLISMASYGLAVIEFVETTMHLIG